MNCLKITFCPSYFILLLIAMGNAISSRFGMIIVSARDSCIHLPRRQPDMEGSTTGPVLKQEWICRFYLPPPLKLT